MSLDIFKANHQLTINFSNDDGSTIENNATINSSINEEDKNVFSVNVTSDALNKIKDFKLAFIAKNTNLKGFRAGKAPINMVWKQHQSELTKEILNETINSSVQNAVNQIGRELAISPKIDLKHFSLEKGLEFEVTLILMPKFDLPDLSKLEIETPAYEISDADISEKAKALMQNHKNYSKAEAKHSSQKGDKVIIDFEGKIDGVAFPGGTSKNHTLELGSKSFIDNFEDQLLKHKAGDKVLVKVTFPKDYHEKNYAGKAAEFDVTINEIHTASTLSSEEEFAKAVGFPSVEELNKRIKEGLEKECSEKSLVRIKTKLFDKLDSVCKFNIPQMMLDEEFNHLWKNVEEMIKNKSEEIDKPEAELREEYTKLANRRVKLGILLSQMAKEYNIKIEQQDLIEVIRAQAMANPAASQAIIEYYTKNPNAVESLRGPVLEEKVVKHLLKSIKTIDKAIKVKDLLTLDEI